MTIKDPIDEPKSKETSYDPFSSLETTTPNDTSLSYDPFSILDEPKDSNVDPVAPFEVEQDTTIATATLATPAEGRVGNSSDCPLLQGVPTSQLPLRFQRLLDVHSVSNDPETVEYLPGFIPSLQTLYYFLMADLVIAIVIIQTWVEGRFERGNEKEGLDVFSYNLIGLVSAVVLSSIASIFVLLRLKKQRAPLNARDSQGNKKPFPGDWKGGIYLVGNTALLEFNTGKSWLFPLESMVSIDHREIRVGRYKKNGISVKFQSSPGFSSDTAAHDIVLDEGDYWWVKVQQWFDRCKNGNADNP